jgi:hypothetical protein
MRECEQPLQANQGTRKEDTNIPDANMNLEPILIKPSLLWSQGGLHVERPRALFLRSLESCNR